MPEVRNGGTWVVVQLQAVDDRRTHVVIEHLGWKQGAEWDRAYPHFTRGWNALMRRLQRRFAEGPTDWTREAMMYQSPARPAN